MRAVRAMLHAEPTLHRLRSLATSILFLGLLALLWPTSLGGRVDYVMVSGTSMEPGMHTGDLVVLRRTGDYEVGDVVSFVVPAGEPGAGIQVIHRIVEGDSSGRFTLQGDNKADMDRWRPTRSDIVGERYLLVPDGGRVLLLLQRPLVLSAVAAAVTFGWVLRPRSASSRRPARRSDTPAPAPS